MKNKVEKFFLWKWLLSIERFVMVFCSIAVLATIAGVVLCRHIFKINFSSSDELLTILALWLYFIGGLYGNYEDNHIRADVMTMFIKKETSERIVNVIIKIISLIVSVLLAVWAFQYLKLCLMLGGKTLVLKLPMMCSRAALVVGYTLPVIYNVYHLVLAVAELLHPGARNDNEQGSKGETEV